MYFFNIELKSIWNSKPGKSTKENNFHTFQGDAHFNFEEII